MRDRRLIGVTALAACVRIAALVFAARLPTFALHRLDAAIYDAGGRAFAGCSFGLGPSVLHMSPLYYYFVGAIYKLAGAGPWPVRLVQLALGVAMVPLLYQSAERLVGRPLAWLAGLTAALYGPFIFDEEQLLATTLSSFLITLDLWLALRALSRPARARDWLAVGVVLGLAAITRPNALLFAAPLALVLALEPVTIRRRAALVAIFAAGVALSIAPVTLRNRVQAGEWILVTDTGGMNFYIGNGAGATGTFRIGPEIGEAGNVNEQLRSFTTVAEHALGRPLRPREVDAYWYRRTLDDIGAHPARFAGLLGRKLALFWNAYELPSSYDYHFTRRLNPVLGAPLVQFRLLGPFALVGTLLLLGRRRDRLALLCALVNLTACASVVLFFVLGHYRMAAIPGLILSAVFCVARLRTWIQERRIRPLAAAAAALVAVAALGWSPVFIPLPESEWFKLGWAYQVQDRSAEAEDAYLQALARNPTHAPSHKNLALLYEHLGDKLHAIVHWQWAYGIAERDGNTPAQTEAASHLQALGATPHSPLCNGTLCPPASSNR